MKPKHLERPLVAGCSVSSPVLGSTIFCDNVVVLFRLQDGRVGDKQRWRFSVFRPAAGNVWPRLPHARWAADYLYYLYKVIVLIPQDTGLNTQICTSENIVFSCTGWQSYIGLTSLSSSLQLRRVMPSTSQCPTARWTTRCPTWCVGLRRIELCCRESAKRGTYWGKSCGGGCVWGEAANTSLLGNVWSERSHSVLWLYDSC